MLTTIFAVGLFSLLSVYGNQKTISPESNKTVTKSYQSDGSLVKTKTKIFKPSQSKHRPKNILFFIVDDQGYNDVGYRDVTFSSPTIDALHRSGLDLPKYYAYSNCSPTRGAFLTGRYTQNIGLQDGAYLPFSIYNSLDPSFPFLPTYLKPLGYQSYGFGKMHLGSLTVKDLPTSKGFDYFFGSIEGTTDQFTHRIGNSCNSNNPVTPDTLPPTYGSNCYYNIAYDVLENDQPYTSELSTGTYFTELLGHKAVEKINNHNPNVPLFLYVAPNAIHAPLQVPDSYLTRCPNVVTASNVQVPNGRKLMCGMLAAVDDMLLNITKALKAKGMYDNTLIIYSSDNGGVAVFGSDNGGFKSQKASQYEGGVRVPAFISGTPVKNLAGKVYDDILQPMDLSATVLKYAGVDKRVIAKLDGNSLLEFKDDSAHISKKFDRQVVYLGSTGKLSAYVNAIVFKLYGKVWKYTNLPNALTLFTGFETNLDYGGFFFDLTTDPYETTNLLGSSRSEIKLAVNYAINLLNSSTINGYPDPLDKLSPLYQSIPPSPLGCLLTEDSPYWNVSNCGGPTNLVPPDKQYVPSVLQVLNSRGFYVGTEIPQYPRYQTSQAPTKGPSVKPTTK